MRWDALAPRALPEGGRPEVLDDDGRHAALEPRGDVPERAIDDVVERAARVRRIAGHRGKVHHADEAAKDAGRLSAR